jgi:hypothetical protein
MKTPPSISHQIGPEQAHLEDCAPWAPATHPDGALYFFDQKRVRLPVPLQLSIATNLRLKRLFTDTDMLDPMLREEMEEFYFYIQGVLHHDGVAILSQNCDLVLDVVCIPDQGVEWSYYYACHEARCLFWVNPYDATHLISELFGVRSPAHISASQTSLQSAVCSL